MQLYQFEKIYSEMGKEFGKIKKGTEDMYALLMFPMEGNALRIHRKYPSSNSRRMSEAIALVLFDIKGRYMGKKFDTGTFRNEDNERLENALLMAFDPLTNEEIKETLQTVQDREWLKDYYREPVRCLLRIKDSVDIWIREMGSDGYFDFIEATLGDKIKGDRMEFTVLAGTEIFDNNDR